jgi:hypothetical protein
MNAFTSSRLLPLPADYRPASFPIRVRILFSDEAPPAS